ncbi:hypothetical protein KO353_08095 [Elioraea tepida]|uniref:Uncharacterized protein n=1 Tax=Elioraea tepida TaxID=2843330 RepID=A0A975U451_9PROT|nr:hypothetical protein [Elioraea tepida]QXM26131.1 hypothetical protein KO353_08095 [Elioraea tepida]
MLAADATPTSPPTPAVLVKGVLILLRRRKRGAVPPDRVSLTSTVRWEGLTRTAAAASALLWLSVAASGPGDRLSLRARAAAFHRVGAACPDQGLGHGLARA